MQKAYKLLAIQEKISNNEAKALIDMGLVSVSGKRLELARVEIKENSVFKVQKPAKPIKIYEDENIIAINKPAFLISEQIAKDFKFELLNRLDKETSGVLLMCKNDEFKQKVIKEFKENRVKKTYFAAIKGIFADEMEINLPISTLKTKSGAFSKIDQIHGKTAISRVYPFLVSNKKSLVKVEIDTGRTHQIRVHLANAGFAVIGDEKYGKNKASRIYLHSYETKLLDYCFKAPLDKSFGELGFELPREITK